MCISDISASINTEIGDLTTVQLSQSYFTTLAPYPWRDESSKEIISCSIFYVTESLQTKDQLNECVDFVYLFVGSGSVPSNTPPYPTNNNLTSRKIHTSDGFSFNCDDNQLVLQWLTGNPAINQYIPADAAVPGTKLASWSNDLYQYVTVVSTSFQTENQGISVNWLTTGTNSFQLQNGIVVKGFTGDVCTCAPSASIQDIPCDSSMSFCISQSSPGSGQFVLPLSGSESVVGSTKTWQVTGNDGQLLIPETSESYSALDGMLNLEIDQHFSCCTCSQHINLTEMHVSNSVSESVLVNFGGTIGSHNMGQVSKIIFTREDGIAPVYTQGPNLGQTQSLMVITLSGSGGPQNGPAGINPEIYSPNLGLAETRIVVPTGSTVEGSVDNIVSNINASSSVIQYFTHLSASRHGTNLVLHRTVQGDCGPFGVQWNAYYINHKYFDGIGGASNPLPEAGQGNASSGNGFVLGNATGSAASSSFGSFSFPGGSSLGSTSVTLSFTRSGCDPSNLPQNLNVCYEESITLGSSLDGYPLEASSSCCFLLQLNNSPFWNYSSSYCQKSFGPFIDLCDVFGACNYDTISYATNDTQYPGIFTSKGPENPNCDSFRADPATLAQGSMVMNFTASAFNIDCINSASGQPSFSAPFHPSGFDSPGQACCPDVSGAVVIYFNPGLQVQDSVQCYPTMSLESSTIYNFPAQGPVSWSIIGGDGSPSPHAIPNFTLNVAPDEIYLDSPDPLLLTFNTATSHSADTEAYLTHQTTSGLYTASVSITNGPCIFTKTFHVKMVSASADAGPDITFCAAGGDPSITMAANGTTGFWQYLGTPPAPLPSIGNPYSPTTKIQQPACSTYDYSWTISSQSLHILNEDTYSVTCEDTDTMTVFTRDAITSASIDGIMTSTGQVTASMYVEDPDEAIRAPYEINIFGCPPYAFSFMGTVDAATTHTTWSVYMSESLTLAGGVQVPPVSTYPNRANDGVMGKFDGNNSSFGFMIGGTIINSESNAANVGRAVAQQTHPPGFPHPSLVSRLFHFSSSLTQSFGLPHYISLTGIDSNCGCQSGSGQTTYGSVVFRPTIESFDIVLPHSPGSATGGLGSPSGHNTQDETTFFIPNNYLVTDPATGLQMPKYVDVVIMSMHSGSNHDTPTTASSVCAKGEENNPMAPYLTMSYCSDLSWPIQPVRKMGPSGSSLQSIPVRSALSTPHQEPPYWPGPGGLPARSHGLTSGSAEPLTFEWRTRQIETYRGNGTQFTPPSEITGAFTDTMANVSYEEAPNFFPAVRAVDLVLGMPGGAVAAGVHEGYQQIGGDYGGVHSQSLEFQCTMSRRSTLDNSVLSVHYASKSVMFCYN